MSFRLLCELSNCSQVVDLIQKIKLYRCLSVSQSESEQKVKKQETAKIGLKCKIRGLYEVEKHRASHEDGVNMAQGQTNSLYENREYR